MIIRKNLTPLKEQALNKIDAEAEEYRLRFVTSGSGQSMTYQQKLREARSFLVGMPGSYPHLNAEVGITGETIEEVAQTVVSMEQQWIDISALIEQHRLAAKKDIRAAQTPAQIETVSFVDWPSVLSAYLS